MSGTPIDPTTRFAREPEARAIALPDGRVLIRHARGASLLARVPLAVIDRLLALVDGRRTAAEIAERLAASMPNLPSRAAYDLLAALEGEMVTRVADASVAESTPGGARPRVLVVGHGALARGIERALAAERLPLRAALDPKIVDGSDLIVCAAEGATYGALFSAQAAWLSSGRTGVPALFVTPEPDGLHVGPLAVPGVGPCVGCAALAALRSTGLAPEAILAALAKVRTGALRGRDSRAALAAVCAEIDAEVSAFFAGAPARVGSVLLLAREGAPRTIPLDRAPDCPLCSAIDGSAVALSPLAARAAVAGVLAEERRREPPAIVGGGPEEFVRTIGIVGGGTAGYLAALALRRKAPRVAVTLIESPAVPVIGVGEATTPLMPQFLHVDLGLDIHRLFAEVRPTWKLGIRFLWGRPERGDFPYPFGPFRPLEAAVYGSPDDLWTASLQAQLMAAGKLGVYRPGADALDVRLASDNAYHLDNERFVAYLERRAAEAGVERIRATIAEVETRDDGRGGLEIAELVAADGRRFAFDLYLDCTGFRALLLERALGVPFVPFERSLWTDRALVAPVPHGGRIRPYTTAETMSAGWCWSTPQEDADHRGYVFASAFLSDDLAEREMRRGNPGMGPSRIVRFRAGRHARAAAGNVVALGNSYGFVEPLESTALHLLIRQIGLLVGSFPLRRGDASFWPLVDRTVAGWWDYLAWFLALHYKFNRRVDSPFWRAARDGVDVARHAELLEVFRARGPLGSDPAARRLFDVPDPLWGAEGIDAILLGQGVPCRLPRPRRGESAWRGRVERVKKAVATALPHEDALALLAERPQLLDRFVAALEAAGTAFGG